MPVASAAASTNRFSRVGGGDDVVLGEKGVGVVVNRGSGVIQNELLPRLLVAFCLPNMVSKSLKGEGVLICCLLRKFDCESEPNCLWKSGCS